MSDQATPQPAEGTVNITIDGREFAAHKGELMITAADRAGTYIPRFCYHPRMKPVGMCRMCLVDVEGPRGATLTPACFTPVAEGQKIITNSEKVKKAQDGILEFLLVNHPLDCPVCDKGGECPLQDQTLAYGPGETRFVEEKRHWDKPIPISPLIQLDRERCIQCARCTRFAEEVAGDPLIDFLGRGDGTEVAIFPDEPFSSNFSGNIVQICPVGALTSTPYRFRARPWDLEQVESSCTSCSVGCRVAVQSSSDEVTRYIGIDNDPVNWGWLCDKGRFDFQAVNSPSRLSVPMVRRGDELVEVTWAEALAAAASGLRAAATVAVPEDEQVEGEPTTRWDGRRIGVIGGARLPNEDAYTWSKVARVVLGTDNVDAQLGDGLPASVVLGLPRATINQAVEAPLVLTLGPDIKEELPILYLRLRHAALEDKLQIVELTPRRGGMSPYAGESLLYQPGSVATLARAIAGGADVDNDVAGVPAANVNAVRQRVAAALAAGRPGTPSIVVILGRPTIAESADGVVEAAQVLGGLPGVAFLSGLRRSNVHGALDLGLAPGVLPGRVGLTEGRSWFESHWGAPLPAEAGLDSAGMLAAAAAGDLPALILVGADPVADFPSAQVASAGLSGAQFVVAVDCFLNDSNRHADVLLPAAGYAERRGTFTNLEGRISWLGQKVTPPGVAWPDWMIAGELGARLGADVGFANVEEIWEEIETVSPLHAGVRNILLGSSAGRDGVVVGVSGGVAPSAPRPLDPMADPGIASAEIHEIPSESLLAARMGAGVTPTAPNDGADIPPRLVFPLAPADPAAAGPAGIPEAPSVGTLRLVATRTMWDAGTTLAHSPNLAPLAPEPVAGLHPTELEARGLFGGDEVTIRSPKGVLVGLRLIADPGLAPGTVAVGCNLAGASATALIDLSAAVTDVEIVLEAGGAA